jgi:hypothetical protein
MLIGSRARICRALAAVLAGWLLTTMTPHPGPAATAGGRLVECVNSGTNPDGWCP